MDMVDSAVGTAVAFQVHDEVLKHVSCEVR